MVALPHDVQRAVENKYLRYTIKIGELNQKYTWASILLYDDDYRRRQAELDFPWGSDAYKKVLISPYKKEFIQSEKFQYHKMALIFYFFVYIIPYTILVVNLPFIIY